MTLYALISMIANQVTITIRNAEQAIRGMIAEAATSGEYDLVSRLSRIAKRLSDLAEEAAADPTPVANVPAQPTTPVKPRANPRSVSRATRRTSRKDGYPRFEKSRDVLIKIGWSKKERSEYSHKAPKTGVDAVVRHVMDLSKGGRMFTTEDLLPVKLGSTGDELPGYQAYISLAWLREIGVVQQHGREGYSVRVDNVLETIEFAWESLPVSRP